MPDLREALWQGEPEEPGFDMADVHRRAGRVRGRRRRVRGGVAVLVALALVAVGGLLARPGDEVRLDEGPAAVATERLEQAEASVEEGLWLSHDRVSAEGQPILLVSLGGQPGTTFSGAATLQRRDEHGWFFDRRVETGFDGTYGTVAPPGEAPMIDNAFAFSEDGIGPLEGVALPALEPGTYRLVRTIGPVEATAQFEVVAGDPVEPVLDPGSPDVVVTPSAIPVGRSGTIRFTNEGDGLVVDHIRWTPAGTALPAVVTDDQVDDVMPMAVDLPTSPPLHEGVWHLTLVGGDGRERRGTLAVVPAPPRTQAPTGDGLWLSHDRVSADGQPILLAVVGVEPGTTYGAGGTLQRWDGEGWVHDRPFGTRLDGFFGAVGDVGQDGFGVEGVLLSTTPERVGPLEGVALPALDPGRYRLVRQVGAGDVTAQFEVVAGDPVEPVLDPGGPDVVVTPSTVPAGFGADPADLIELRRRSGEPVTPTSLTLAHLTGSAEIISSNDRLALGEYPSPGVPVGESLAPGVWSVRVITSGEEELAGTLAVVPRAAGPAVPTAADGPDRGVCLVLAAHERRGPVDVPMGLGIQDAVEAGLRDGWALAGPLVQVEVDHADSVDGDWWTAATVRHPDGALATAVWYGPDRDATWTGGVAPTLETLTDRPEAAHLYAASPVAESASTWRPITGSAYGGQGRVDEGLRALDACGWALDPPVLTTPNPSPSS